ncbi:MAG: hypothetical protein ACYTGW_11155 [Planctomycetota bacterium]|jgi:hypothetical protein
MKLLLGLSVGLMATVAAAQIPLPKYLNTFSASATRGFYFKTPVGFVLTHAQVPDEKNAGKQMVAIYKLTAAPPAFSQTVNVTPLFFKTGVDSKQLIQVIPPLVFKKDDFVAVLGACGPNTGTVHNSYGSGYYPSFILGQPITLSRCLIQSNLAAVSGKGGMSSEGAGSIARVRLFVAGHGRAVQYGNGTGLGSIPAPTLLPSDPLPPSINKQAEMFLIPGTASNTGGILAIGILRSNIPTGIGTLLNSPFLTTMGVAGPIPTAGSSLKFAVPNDNNLLGFRVTFQAAVGVTGGLTLTNGLEWTAGR